MRLTLLLLTGDEEGTHHHRKRTSNLKLVFFIIFVGLTLSWSASVRKIRKLLFGQVFA